MKQNIDKKISELSKNIEITNKPFSRLQNIIKDELIISQSLFNIKQLLVELLLNSKIDHLFSLSEAKKFEKEYNKLKNRNINVDLLFDKSWIIYTGGTVVIPDQIRKTFYYFRYPSKEKTDFVSNNTKELEFIYELYKKIGYHDEHPPYLEKDIALKLINNYKKHFVKCYTIKELIRTGYLKPEKNGKLPISLTRLGALPKVYKDEISATLLLKIINKHNNGISENILSEWIQLISNFHHVDSLQGFVDSYNINEIKKIAYSLVRKEASLNFKDSESLLKQLNIQISYGSPCMINDNNNYKITNDSSYNLYNTLLKIENKYDLLTYQDNTYSYIDQLLRLILSNEERNDHCADKSFVSLIELLKESKKQPLVFWKLLDLIKKNSPEIVPYFLLHEDLADIAIQIFSDIELNKTNDLLQCNNEIKILEKKNLSKIWLSLFELYLDISIYKNIESEILVKNINRIFILILKDAFKAPGNNLYSLNLRISNISFNKYREALNILTSYSKTKISNRQVKLLTKLINNLYQNFIELSEKNRTESFDIYKYDYLILIIKEYEYIKDTDSSFQQNFKNSINTLIDFFKKDFDKDLRWDKDIDRLDDIEWQYLFIQAHDNGKLCELFKVDIKVDKDVKEENLYINNYNQVQKMRLFLNILLCAYNQLNDSSNRLKAKDINTEYLKLALENEIGRILKNNFLQKDKQTVKLFDQTFERYFFGGKQRNLLKYLSKTLNYFSSETKNQIFNSFINGKQSLDKLLTLFNNLESERDRDILKRIIESISIETFIDEINWLPTIETGLIEALNSGIFWKIADRIYVFYEKQIESKNQIYVKDKKELLLKIRSFIAYRENNIDDLEKVKYDITVTSEKDKQSFDNQKNFFKALILQNNKEFGLAMNIFEQICSAEPDNVEFILRKLILKSDISLDKMEIKYKQAITEIQEIYEDLEKLENKIIDIKQNKPEFEINFTPLNYLKAFCLLHLQKYSEFDYLYWDKLSYVERLSKEFIEVAIERYINDNLGNKAYELLLEAIHFHKHENNTEPDFIIKLRKRLQAKQIEPNVQKLFEVLLLQESKQRISSVPSAINPKTDDFGQFLLYEICSASKDLLSKVSTINKLLVYKNENDNNLIDENEITDFLELLVNSRINYLQIHLNSQQRKGIGANGFGTGMPDLSMSIGLSDITLEAVRAYKSKYFSHNKNRIIEHINKSFDYSTSKYAFYNIVYYENNDFDKGWEYFKEEIIGNCDFTGNYILDGEVIDLSQNYENNAIRVCLTNHISGLKFYHIYLHWAYSIKTDQ